MADSLRQLVNRLVGNMRHVFSDALDKLLNNQLAQVCNNLYCTIQDVKSYRANLPTDNKLWTIQCELEAEYNKLFTLIYGDK